MIHIFKLVNCVCCGADVSCCLTSWRLFQPHRRESLASSFTNTQWKQSLLLAYIYASYNCDTNCAGIYCMYASEKRGSGESPFTDVILFRSSAFRERRPHFCQQLTPIYNVFTKNTSSTVIRRMMVYYLSEGCSFAASSFDKFGARSQVACGWSRSHDLLNSDHTLVRATTKYRAQQRTTNILQF